MSVKVKGMNDSPKKDVKPVQELEKKEKVVPHVSLVDIQSLRDSAIRNDRELADAEVQLREKLEKVTKTREQLSVSVAVYNSLIKKARV